MLGPKEDDDKIMVTLTVTCTSEAEVLKVTETLTRIGTGFSLEGLSTSINSMRYSPTENYGEGI